MKDTLLNDYMGTWKMHVAAGKIILSEKVKRILGVGQDVTYQKKIEVTRKQVEEILKESYQQLERKDNFIRIASHELKTPITSMQGYVQLLMKSYENHPDAFLTDSLKIVNTQINKLTKLINELLDITKADTGKIKLQIEPFDIGEVIEETISFMQPTAKHQLILTGEKHLQIIADKERISRVFINLLTNAIKYSPQADKVLINVSKNNSLVTVSVTDYGIGIPGEFHPKIFDCFYRVQSSKNQTVSGFGIGLYIASEIIATHKGKIWVESKENKGSTFYFSLPLL